MRGKIKRFDLGRVWIVHACLIVLVAVSGCGGHRTRSDETFARTDVNPTYIPSPPIGKSIAVFFAATGIVNSYTETVVNAARDALVRELQSRGYNPVAAGKPGVLCEWNSWSGPEPEYLCEERFNHQEREQVLSFLKKKGISTALMVQITFTTIHSGTINERRIIDGVVVSDVKRNPYFIVSMPLRLLDESGLLLRRASLSWIFYTGNQWLFSLFNTGMLWHEGYTDKSGVGVTHGGAEGWGLALGAAISNPEAEYFASQFVGPAPSVDEIREILTRNAWTLAWKHTYWERGASEKSGQHTVHFAQRDQDFIVTIGSDDILGSGVSESKVTVTRAGISYFSPKLGRVRMKFAVEGGRASFIGGVSVPKTGGLLVKVGPPDYTYPNEGEYHAQTHLHPAP